MHFKKYDMKQCIDRMQILLQQSSRGLIHNPTLLQQQLQARKAPVTSYHRNEI